MERAKVKTKERNTKVEELRSSGVNAIDNKFNAVQEELQASRDANINKIEKMTSVKVNIRDKEQIKEDEAPSCSKCGSKHITAQKQGFGIGKAVVGVVALGPIGTLAGGINKNKIELTCLKCGNKFKIKR